MDHAKAGKTFPNQNLRKMFFSLWLDCSPSDLYYKSNLFYSNGKEVEHTFSVSLLIWSKRELFLVYFVLFKQFAYYIKNCRLQPGI